MNWFTIIQSCIKGESLWGDTYRQRVLPKEKEDGRVTKDLLTNESTETENLANEDLSSSTTKETNGINQSIASPSVATITSVTSSNATNEKEEVMEVDSTSSPSQDDAPPFEISTNETTHSTPDRRSRSSFQTPLLDDIIEVESLPSHDSEKSLDKEVVNTNMTPKEAPEGKRSCDNNDATDPKVHLTNQNEVKDQVNTPTVSSGRENSKPELLNAKSNSFEERMSVLHQKMEAQLLDKLQHLEEKISQSQQQKIEASAEETMELKKDLAASAAAVIQLRTDIATKDLEMLKLRQNVVHLEASLEASLTKPTTFYANIGDGELNPDKLTMHEESVLAAKTQLELELNNARTEIESLQRQAIQTSKQLQETRHQLEVTEKSVENEKASSASMMLLLEQKSNDKDLVDSALTKKLLEEKEQLELALSELRNKLTQLQDTARIETTTQLEESVTLKDELLAERLQVSKLEDDLANAATSHRSSLIDLKVQHDKQLNEIRSQLIQAHREELQAIQEQLKEEQLSRMELEFASNEAINSMERAVDKANVAEAQLKQMTDMINETQALKESNDKLHSTLQAETEKRKILHNTIEDMKGKYSNLNHPICLKSLYRD